MSREFHGNMEEIFRDIISEMGFIDVGPFEGDLDSVSKDFIFDIQLSNTETRLVVFFSKGLAEILYENIFAGCEGEGLHTEDAVKEFLNVFAGNLLAKIDIDVEFDLGIPEALDLKKFDFKRYKFLYFQDVEDNTVAVGHNINIVSK